MHDTLLIIHILAAGTWIGGSLTVMFLNGRVRTAGHASASGFMAAFEQMGRLYYPPTAIVLVVTGALLVIDNDHHSFNDAFVLIGIAIVIAGALLGSLVFDPIAKQARQAHDEGNEAEIAKIYRRFTNYGVLDIALLVFAVAVMVVEWGS
jgi:uncharacterized membrane protein